MKRVCLFLVFVTGIVLSSRPSDAQYTADFQTNIISGVTSNWMGDYLVGNTNYADVLLIQNGGKLMGNGSGYVGSNIGSSNNVVLVADTNSVWSNPSDLRIGNSGPNNSLIISNGAQMANNNGYMGYDSSSSNNSLLVTGLGSIWSSSTALYIGHTGAGNIMMIADGGRVFSVYGYVGGWSSTGRSNFVLVTGVGSVWSNQNWLSFGQSSRGNSMIISNGGRVVAPSAYVGEDYISSNSVTVTGTGSVWITTSDVHFFGSQNTLVVNAGGKVVDDSAYIGSYAGSNIIVLVTDVGSVWSNQSSLNVGHAGSGNSLVVSNGGIVVDATGRLGVYDTDHGNAARVVDNGVWRGYDLYVGSMGSGNSLTIDGGSVIQDYSVVIGTSSSSCDNLLTLDNGSLFVTNPVHSATLEVRQGQLILNGGVLQADKLVITNACARFAHNGGTLVVGTLMLDPSMDADGDGMPNGYEQSYGLDPLNAADANADADGDGMSNFQEDLAGTDPTNGASVFRITEIWPEDDDMFLTWSAVGGKRYVLQTTTGDSGDLSNDFFDLNPAIVAPGTGETEVTVSDLGGATNGPTRFYRVRLVP